MAYNQFYGFKCKPDDEIEYETTMPNNLNGKSMKANAKLWISDIDTVYNSIEFINTIEPDSMEIKKSIVDYFKNYSQNNNNAEMGQAAKDIEDKAMTKIYDKYTYSYDVYDGWLDYYIRSTTVYMNDKPVRKIIFYMQIK